MLSEQRQNSQSLQRFANDCLLDIYDMSRYERWLLCIDLSVMDVFNSLLGDFGSVFKLTLRPIGILGFTWYESTGTLGLVGK